MSKRRKEDAGSPSPTPDSAFEELCFQSTDCQAPFCCECTNGPVSSTPVRHRTESQSSCSSRHYTRYDSGLGGSISEDTSVLAYADTILEELLDPFSDEAESEEEDHLTDNIPELHISSADVGLLSSFSPYSPDRDHLAPPSNDYHRGLNGSLTPVSFERLRTYSEGNNDDFEWEFEHGRLSDPSLEHDVISARLVNIAHQLDVGHFSTPSPQEDDVLDEISARLRDVAQQLDMQYFREPVLPQAILTMGFVIIAVIWFSKR